MQFPFCIFELSRCLVWLTFSTEEDTKSLLSIWDHERRKKSWEGCFHLVFSYHTYFFLQKGKFFFASVSVCYITWAFEWCTHPIGSPRKCLHTAANYEANYVFKPFLTFLVLAKTNTPKSLNNRANCFPTLFLLLIWHYPPIIYYSIWIWFQLNMSHTEHWQPIHQGWSNSKYTNGFALLVSRKLHVVWSARFRKRYRYK